MRRTAWSIRFRCSVFRDSGNQGYNTAAVELLKTFAQEQGIRSLNAYVVEENHGSRKVIGEMRISQNGHSSF